MGPRRTLNLRAFIIQFFFQEILREPRAMDRLGIDQHTKKIDHPFLQAEDEMADTLIFQVASLCSTLQPL
jgi:hypothetical protein